MFVYAMLELDLNVQGEEMDSGMNEMLMSTVQTAM